MQENNLITLYKGGKIKKHATEKLHALLVFTSFLIKALLQQRHQ